MSESTNVTKRDETQRPQSVLQVLGSSSFKQQVAAALPRHISVDSMMRIALTEVRMDPDLQKCTVPSFMGALLLAAQSGLRPGMFGEGWIVARWNNKLSSLEARFQPGYMGLVQLAYRSGEVVEIHAVAVYKADDFRYQLGSEPRIEHVPDMEAEHRDEDIVAFYAVVKLRTGGTLMRVMPRRDVDAVRDRFGPHTKAGKLVGPWVSDYEPMGCKTVLIQTLKLAPRDSERLQSALQAEQDAVFGDRSATNAVTSGKPAAERVAERLGVKAEPLGEVIGIAGLSAKPAPEAQEAVEDAAEASGAADPAAASEGVTEADKAKDEAFLAATDTHAAAKATKPQLNMISILLRKTRLPEDEWRGYLLSLTGKRSRRDLSKDEASTFIDFLAVPGRSKKADKTPRQ